MSIGLSMIVAGCGLLVMAIIASVVYVVTVGARKKKLKEYLSNEYEW